MVTGDSAGRVLAVVGGGFSVTYVYGNGLVQSTVTAPDGSVTSFQDQAQALRSGPAEDGPCQAVADCPVPREDSPRLLDTDVPRLEKLIDGGLVAFRRITTVPFCAQPVGVPTCKAIEALADNGPGLKDRITNRARYLSERLGNAVNCAVNLAQVDCGKAIMDKSPDLVREIKRLGSGVPPTGSFQIGATALTPDKDGWADYLAAAGSTMTDVPCAESVFAAIRPECSPAAPATPPPGNTAAAIDPRTGCGGLTEYMVGSFRGCKDSAGRLQGQYLEYYADGKLKVQTTYVDGLANGIKRNYQPNGKLLVETTWVANKLSGPARTYYSNGSLSSEGQYMNNQREGVWNIYSANGTKTTETFAANTLVVTGSSQPNKINSNASRWGCPATGCTSGTSGGSSGGSGSNAGSGAGNANGILSCRTTSVCTEYELPANKLSQFAKQCRAAGARVTEGARACPAAPNCTHTGNGMVQTTFALTASVSLVRSSCQSTRGVFASQ